jgi:hypothetical protein
VSDANRLNVLVSRAKHGMILFGDLHFLSTTARSESGKRLWNRMKTLLLAGGHVYTSGLPIVCARHPAVCSDISAPSQFSQCAPNGGCTQVSGFAAANACTSSTAADTAVRLRSLIDVVCKRSTSCM